MTNCWVEQEANPISQEKAPYKTIPSTEVLYLGYSIFLFLYYVQFAFQS